MFEYLETDDFINDFLKGEQKAFTEVFNRYFSEIYVFAAKLILNNEQAEELAIDTFRKLFLKNLHFDNLPNMKAFLYVTVRNACLNYILYINRLTKKQKALLADLQNEQKLENKQIEGDLIHNLHKALEKLPPKSGKIVQMIYLEGLKYKEVADQLNISVNTVKSQREDAIKLLRKYLSPQHMIAIWLLYLVPIVHRIK